MVKNTHGGNKSKSMARKNVTTDRKDTVLRLPTCDFEKIAQVTKLLGNGMFYAKTTDQLELLGRIRNKFKGRARRDNDISVGKFVLVGLREWASTHNECDLLNVYDAIDYDALRNIPTLDFSAFDIHEHHDSDLLFTHSDSSLHLHTPLSSITSSLPSYSLPSSHDDISFCDI
jgi:translation initiation factor IF-1